MNFQLHQICKFQISQNWLKTLEGIWAESKFKSITRVSTGGSHEHVDQQNKF